MNIGRRLVLTLAGLAAVSAPLAALDKSIGVVLLTRGHQFTRDLADEITAA